MTLIKWVNRPTLMNEIGSIFDSLSADSPINFYNNNITWVPQFETHEDDNSYQIFAELPGVSKKKLDIEISDGLMVISGEKEKNYTKNDASDYSELSYGKFSRSFKLPEDILSDEISAKMKDGILAVFVPRMEQVKPESKKIKIK